MDRTDEELVQECLAGDQAAYSELVRRHQGRIFAMAFRALRDEALAEDLAQDAFLRAYRSLGRFQTGRRFGPWLSAIAANRIRDFIKTRARRSEVPWELDRSPASGQSTPLERAAAREMLQKVEGGVAQMPEETREVLRLRFVMGMDYEDVAQALDIPLGTVKSRISRARLQLKQILTEVMD